MKSPFPGMDPYIEKYWRDIHARLIIYSSDEINAQLPDDLRCRVEERVVVEPDEGKPRNIYPDVRVVERPERPGGVAVLEPATEVAYGESVVLDVQSDAASETYLEIIDNASGKKVVTVIEFLSLANKLPGEGQILYRKKQAEVLASDASLVEIDLLRDGQRVQAVDENLVPLDLRTPYRACVRRPWIPMKYEFFPIRLRERLPAIRIPLREKDAEVRLALQPLIDRCYHLGRYDDIDYSVAVDPPLSPADAEWARGLVSQA